jgi:DNA-binding MarR family transcriptional regulator
VQQPPSRTWTFLTNHGHVLIYLARHPDARVRDIAAAVGITERATVAILGDLVDGGYVERQRVGRRNTYEVRAEAALRHPEESDHRVGEILGVFMQE